MLNKKENWKNINKAPKDGTWILCAWKNSVGRWGIPICLYWHNSGCWTDIDPASKPVIENTIKPIYWVTLPNNPIEGEER